MRAVGVREGWVGLGWIYTQKSAGCLSAASVIASEELDTHNTAAVFFCTHHVKQMCLATLGMSLTWSKEQECGIVCLYQYKHARGLGRVCMSMGARGVEIV